MSPGGMTVDVRTIPQTGLDRTWTCSAEELGLDSELVALPEVAAIAVRITRNGREVRVQGTIRARLGQTCGRCLEPFEQDADLPLEVMYIPAGEGDGAGRDADEEPGMGLGWYDGAHVNLQADVRDAVLLSLPMTPRCRPDCQGLCAQCGANLNAEPCACPAEENASPFAALNDLKAKMAADSAVEHKDD